MIYFFDDAHIAACDGLVRAPGPVEKLGIVLEPDLPWDGRRCVSFGGSIIDLEDGRYRLYYSAEGSGNVRAGIAVAESNDGLVWNKPGLPLVAYEGNSTNRILIRGLPEEVERCGQGQVLRLPDGRWRMYFWTRKPALRYTVAESEDALDWQVPDFGRPALYHPLELGTWGWESGEWPPKGTGDMEAVRGREAKPAELMRIKGMRSNDATYVYRDPKTGEYVMYSVWMLPNPEGSVRRVEYDNAYFALRTIHRRTSEDGLCWSPAELLITPDERDPLDQQFYYLAVHRQDGWHIGFLGHYRVVDQTMDIELCFSRDGRRWDRPIRGPFVPRGPVGSEDSMMVLAPQRLIPQGDDWLMLYTGSSRRHCEGREAGQGGDFRDVVCAARFSKRRFLGLSTVGERVGQLWTRPFILTAGEVRIDARIQGWVRAELCDAFGAPLPGFSKGESQVVSGDSTGQVLGWKKEDAGRYQHEAVSLRLEIQRGEIYAICDQ
jgi:hypothetical protein